MDAAKASANQPEFSDINDIPVDKDHADVEPYMESAPYARLKHQVDHSLLWACLLTLLFLLVAITVCCPSLLILTILLPVCIVLKHLASCCCTCKCGTFLSHMDLFWLNDLPDNKMGVQSLFYVDKSMTFESVRELLNSRLVNAEMSNGKRRYPRFRQTVKATKSGYVWAQTNNFDIDNHVFKIRGSIKNKKQLETYAGGLAAKGFTFEHPPWEVHVLMEWKEPHLTPIIFRYHPCFADGISLSKAFYQTVFDHNEAVLKPRSGSGALFFNFVRALIVGPLVFLARWLWYRTDYNFLHHGLDNLTGEKVVTWSDAIHLPTVTRIKQVTRSSMNDVLLCALSGSLRTYLQCQKVQHPYDMQAIIPVDFRNESPPYSPVDLGNFYSLVTVPLPTNTEGSIPRLWDIKHRMDELKNSADPVAMYGAMYILRYILPYSIYRRLLRSIYNKASILVCNFPGAECNMSLASKNVRMASFWMSPPESISISVSLCTFGGHLRMGVLADKAAVPDVNVLVADFIYQLQELSQLLSNRRIPGEYGRHRQYDDDDIDEAPETPVEVLQGKLHEVQEELANIRARLEEGDTSVELGMAESELNQHVEELKEEFSELLAEIRRRRASLIGANIQMEDEEYSSGQLIRAGSGRRRLSSASRRSLVSLMSTSRPLTAPGSPKRRKSIAQESISMDRRTSYSSSMSEQPPQYMQAKSVMSPSFTTTAILEPGAACMGATSGVQVGQQQAAAASGGEGTSPPPSSTTTVIVDMLPTSSAVAAAAAPSGTVTSTHAVTHSCDSMPTIDKNL